MNVLKRVSIPPNPQLPSFFTLPPEIRNVIYDLLFTRENAVFLDNVRKHPWTALLQPPPGLSLARCRDRGRILAIKKASLGLFDHGLSEGFGLLKSYCQVYDEVVDVYIVRTLSLYLVFELRMIFDTMMRPNLFRSLYDLPMRARRFTSTQNPHREECDGS
jgi:hypothetical protein